MANFDEQLTQEQEQQNTIPQDEVVEVVVNEQDQKTQTINKAKAKRPSKVKGAFSELKKVTWPNFGKVMKQTAVVLSVTLVFLVLIIGIDQLLYLLYNLLTKNAFFV